MQGPRLARDSSLFKLLFAFPCLLLVSLCWGCSNGGSSTTQPPPPPPATFDLVQVASGFSNPLDIQQPDDSSGRLFVVEQGGHIQIIQSNGTRAAPPFLDVTDPLSLTSRGEVGLPRVAY